MGIVFSAIGQYFEDIMKYKIWKPGKADEDWKVKICVRDIKETNELIQSLEYILGKPIEDFHGLEIKSALIQYIESCKKSIDYA